MDEFSECVRLAAMHPSASPGLAMLAIDHVEPTAIAARFHVKPRLDPSGGELKFHVKSLGDLSLGSKCAMGLAAHHEIASRFT